MHIKYQIKLIIGAFIVLIVLCIGLAFALQRGVATMNADARWTKHTNDVKTAVQEMRTAYAEAESLGRLAIVDATNRPRLPAMRDKVFEKISNLTALVSDNQAQIDNARTMERLIAERFKVQDKQAQVVKSDGNGGIISDASLTIESIESQNRVVHSFDVFLLAEDELLAVRRANLLSSQWRIAYVFIVLIALLFFHCVSAFYLTYKALNRNIYVGGDMKESLPGNGEQVVTVNRNVFENWIKQIEQSEEVNA